MTPPTRVAPSLYPKPRNLGTGVDHLCKIPGGRRTWKQESLRDYFHMTWKEDEAPIQASSTGQITPFLFHWSEPSIVARLAKLEEMVQDTHKLVLMISQAYYWTPEWQAKERRADEDEALGRSKVFESVDELIAELNG